MPAARPPTPAPPVPDPLVALADRCVQCGLCLPVCPTYSLERLETESPRGRIALTRAWALDTIAPTAAADTHLDHCLGCRSCEAVCPAGVEYGQLLVQARQRQRERRLPAWRQRLIEGLAARPRWLNAGLGLYRRAHGWLPASLRPLPRPPRPVPWPSRPAPATRVGLFVGCVAQAYESPLRAALARLCGALGVELDPVAGQGCCGALHEHAGNRDSAARLAAGNRAAFAGHDTVLTLASGCHDGVARALGGGVRTVDALSFLGERAAALRWRATPQRVALHLPCTQRNVVKSVPALRRLLAGVPGLEVIELDAGYGCCGASGTQMFADPGRAAEYRAPLIEQFLRSGATRLLSANIGCRLHLGNGTTAPVQHPLEFLAQCLEEIPPG
ncbi:MULTISPECIES: (Fe-S)-binding protein [unclassified Lysobacter]|uniref:(Fe-S)-binding protein n=1 Tax=unclassified Lysobacter TaxID=2635362 RepID=UPI001BE6BBBA|nr:MULTISPECIES: (Fe-S)-binding protein [unclassified Lysobacter]MBT2745074.1 (Fe-S)-binding protein [Lysobacter sp. ISL-42]MBT2751010.1 (Fe-S)-binding protein [Lysobacter sp. ISL-50]MBT2775897.1 (Fe-S)-binding protein [Lysobacter sp. ISL-54]MBT2782799.1 (Fe-S)-binding protein [Lysobacter sp. ISL-52]